MKLLYIVLGAQLVVSRQIHTLNNDLSNLQNRTIYSVDSLQKTYAQDLGEFFSTGCREGTNWEPGPPVVGFNPNNEVSYCADKLKEREALIKYLVDNVGR